MKKYFSAFISVILLIADNAKDGNENENTIRHELIDILEQKVSRDRSDHEADQTRQRKLQCIFGGSQHGKNTDDTGLGLELQSH